MTGTAVAELSPAARAFDAVAGSFDDRFGTWLSVAAQRRAVRAVLADCFPVGSRLIEVGGGTGEDALWLMERGRDVLLTDPAPEMVRVARSKLGDCTGGIAKVAAAEEIGELAGARFDGAYSNFAALNCIGDLRPFAAGLARLLHVGAPAILVLFGTFCPGEMIVETVRGRPRNTLRRMARGDVPARLGGHDFTVRYHRAADLERAMAPWFEPRGRQGVGLFVPPSAAEPWISRHPKLLAAFERLDRALPPALALFGDHILYRFVRTDVAADAA